MRPVRNLARELASPLTVAFVLVGASLFAAHDPGSGSLPWLGAAALLLSLVVFAVRGAPGGMVALLPLGLLAAWCAITIAWSQDPDRSWSYTNRTLVYLAFALLGALVGADARRLFYGVAVLLGAVCVWSLVGKVLPWVYEDYGRIARLRSPVGYWNVLALLGDIALPVGLCLATRFRAAGTLLVYGWLIVIGLTYSRGGVLVAVAVVGLWMLLSKAGIEAVSTLIAAGLPAAAVLAVAFSLTGLTSDGQSHSARVQAGAVFGVVLIADALIAVALAHYPLPRVTAVRRLGLAVLAIAIAAALGVGAARAHTWWHSFTSSSGTELTNSPGRLTDAGGNFRYSWWQQAWQGFEHAKLQGTGAGTFEGTNLRYRTTSLDQTIEPHDLPLQFLSETGIVGGVLFLVSIGVLAFRARRRPGPQLALALALPAYFLHGLLDLDWDFLSVTGLVLFVAGALAVRPPAVQRRPRAFAVVAATGLAAAIALSLGAVWLSGRWDAEAAAAVGVDDAHAVSLAKKARSLNPFALDPLYQAAAAEVDRGTRIKLTHGDGWLVAYQSAGGYYLKATQVQPKSADAWFQLGYFELVTRGCPRAALPAFNEATVYDGRNPTYNTFYASTLARVNSGKPRC